jgi:hypothetical protein
MYEVDLRLALLLIERGFAEAGRPPGELDRAADRKR